MRLDPSLETVCPNLTFRGNTSSGPKGGIFPSKTYTSGIWNNIPKDVQCKDLTEFKDYTKKLKPMRYKHFSRGNKLSNSLLTKIRVGRSDLSQHKFTIYVKLTILVLGP